MIWRPSLRVVSFKRPTPPVVPCFPGAEGFGTETIGGRGGRTYFVDNLNDSGPGSFRDAAEAQEPRMVVFRVSGTIFNQKPLVIDGDRMTVCGQTAPGDGFCVGGEETRIQASDILIRHLRFRRGDTVPARDGFDDADALNIGSPKKVGGVQRVVLDHCSFSWSIDETVNTLFKCHDITFSWCIFSEGLYNSLHPEGPHSMGPNFGAFTKNISVHHSLIAHCNQRNPQAAGANLIDFRNNVVYNWGEHAAEWKNPQHLVNFVKCVYKYGPNSTGALSPGPATITGVLAVDTTDVGMQIYAIGNRDPRAPASIVNLDVLDDWQMIQVAGTGEQIPDEFKVGHWRNEPVPAPFVTTRQADAAMADVLSKAGATKPKRDAVDTRVCNDVVNGTGQIIDSQDDVGGWPTLNTGTLPTDTDEDGIPDEWEDQNGSNRLLAADAQVIEPGQPYTWLERYANSIA